MTDLHHTLTGLIRGLHHDTSFSPFVETLLLLLAIFCAVVVIEVLIRLIFLRLLEALLRRIPLFKSITPHLDTTIIRRGIRLFAVGLLRGLLPLAFEAPLGSGLFKGLMIICNIYILILIIQIISNIMDASRSYLIHKPAYRNNPFINLFQVVKVVMVFLGFIYVISILFEVDVTKIFAGLATASAVLLLIFKDTILGFVAGIQLSSNDMVRVGDWITLSKYGVDGDVIDITLNTVKVRNFDKTISTVPPYTLISESFVNWRGMSNSGGRRIRRAINIDVHTIRFIEEEELEQILSSPHLLPDILNGDSLHKELKVSGLTNLTLFRRYVEGYLAQAPFVHTAYTCMVLQKEPTELGLPLFVYFFTNTTDWKAYEDIQSQLFEYLFAIVSYFDLYPVQQIARRDLLEYKG